MKKTLVVLLALVMVFALATTAMAADEQYVAYPDIADIDADLQTAIERLSILGVLNGYNIEGTVFAPNQLITREEFAKVAVYAAGLEDQIAIYAAMAPAFTDVPDGYWSEGSINLAKDHGLMIGRSATTFDRTSNVTMQEVVTVALRLAGYDSRLPGEWPAEFNNKAVAVGLTQYVDFIGPKYATRAEVASLVNEALDLYMVQYVENSVAQGIGQAVNNFVSNISTDIRGLRNSVLDLGAVDADGFGYLAHYTNESSKASRVPVLYKSFGAYVTYGYFADNESALSETTGWGFDDFDDWELLFYFADGVDLIDSIDEDDDYYEIEVASLYGISHGGNVTDLGWQEAALTVFDNGETRKAKRIGDEVCYVEFLSTVERIADVEKNIKVEVDDLDQKDDILAKGKYGEVWYDEAGDIYAVKDFKKFETANFGIVDSSSETSVEFKEVFTVGAFSGDKLNLKKQDYAFFLMGEGFINAEDLETGDVIYLETKSYERLEIAAHMDDVEVCLVFRAELGSLEKLGADYITIDDVKYGAQDMQGPFAANSYYSLNLGRTVYNYNLSALFTTDWSSTVMWVPSYAFVNFAYVIDDIMNSQMGVLNKYYYDDGKKRLYYDAETTATINGMQIMDVDGDMVDVDFEDEVRINFASNRDYPVEGSLVEYYVNADGEFNGWVRVPMTFGNNTLYVGHLFSQRYNLDFECPGKDWGDLADSVIGVITNNGSLRLSSDGDTDVYKVADDAVVFLVDSTQLRVSQGQPHNVYDIDSVEVISGADLIADGDFNASRLCIYETTGNQATIIWIRDYDLVGEVEYGYGMFLPGNIGQLVVDDGDNYYFVTIGNRDVKVPAFFIAGLGLSDPNAAFVAYKLEDGEVAAFSIIDYCAAQTAFGDIAEIYDEIGIESIVCGNISSLSASELKIDTNSGQVIFAGNYRGTYFINDEDLIYDLSDGDDPVALDYDDLDKMLDELNPQDPTDKIHVIVIADDDHDVIAVLVVKEHRARPTP